MPVTGPAASPSLATMRSQPVSFGSRGGEWPIMPDQALGFCSLWARDMN